MDQNLTAQQREPRAGEHPRKLRRSTTCGVIRDASPVDYADVEEVCGEEAVESDDVDDGVDRLSVR